VHSLTYDARNQHVEVEEWLQGSVSQVSTFADWDANGTPRYSSSELDGALEWQQVVTTDNRGRVRTTATDVGGVVIPVTYDYTLGSRISHVTVPGLGWSYLYTAGMLQHVQLDTGPVVALVSGRDSAGRVTDLSLHYGGHVERSYGYSGTLDSETVVASTGDATTLDYEYDTLGRMSATVQSGALGSRRDEYDYSFEGWLLHEDRDVYGPDAESTTFSYDQAGNRLTPVMPPTGARALACSADPDAVLGRGIRDRCAG